MDIEIDDVILDTDNIDWQACLQPWGWLLKKNPAFHIWLLTRFGEIIITDDNGEVWFLRTSGSSYEKVAESEEAFIESLSDPAAIEYYFMPIILNKLNEAGMSLSPGECFGFCVPRGFEEFSLEPDNFKTISVDEYLPALGGMLGQMYQAAEGHQSLS